MEIFGLLIWLVFYIFCILGFAWIYHAASTPGRLAKIAELRHKVENFNKLDLHTQGIVIRQVTRTNYDIKKMRQVKRRLGEWFIPDDWEEVRLIELPRNTEEREWKDMSSEERLNFLNYLKEKQQNV